jgi:hypothetical protein
MITTLISSLISICMASISNTELLIILPVALILLAIMYVALPNKTEIKESKVCISSIYGHNIRLQDIKAVELAETLPKIRLRSGGLTLGPIRKGIFILEDLGQCQLYLNGDYSPYLLLRTYKDEIIILNCSDNEHTRALYHTIRQHIAKR